jgi:hypothetical protein
MCHFIALNSRLLFHPRTPGFKAATRVVAMKVVAIWEILVTAIRGTVVVVVVVAIG